MASGAQSPPWVLLYRRASEALASCGLVASSLKLARDQQYCCCRRCCCCCAAAVLFDDGRIALRGRRRCSAAFSFDIRNIPRGQRTHNTQHQSSIKLGQNVSKWAMPAGSGRAPLCFAPALNFALSWLVYALCSYVLLWMMTVPFFRNTIAVINHTRYEGVLRRKLPTRLLVYKLKSTSC